MKPQEAIDFLKDRFDYWRPEFRLYEWTIHAVVADTDDTPTWFDVFPGSENVTVILAPLDAVKKTPRELDQLVFRACFYAVVEARDGCLRDGDYEDAEPYEETLVRISNAAYQCMAEWPDTSETAREWL